MGGDWLSEDEDWTCWHVWAAAADVRHGGIEICSRESVVEQNSGHRVVAIAKCSVTVVTIHSEQYTIALAHAPDETEGEEAIKKWWQHSRQSSEARRNLPVILLADAHARISEEKNTYHGGCEAERENASGAELKEMLTTRAMCAAHTFLAAGLTWRSSRIDYVCIHGDSPRPASSQPSW